jgi:hypothetical protein
MPRSAKMPYRRKEGSCNGRTESLSRRLADLYHLIGIITHKKRCECKQELAQSVLFNLPLKLNSGHLHQFGRA